MKKAELLNDADVAEILKHSRYAVSPRDHYDKPLVVGTTKARFLLGNICRDKLWSLIKRGELGEI